MKIPVNNQWLFNDGNCTADVDIPHSISLGQNYFDETRLWYKACYSKTLTRPDMEPGSRLFILFEAVSSKAKVYCNSKLLSTHFGSYDSFEFEILDSSENLEIKVEVSSYEDPLIPPFGNQMDYLSFDGIYRPVYLVTRPQCYIEHAFISPSLNGDIAIRCITNGLCDFKGLCIEDPNHRVHEYAPQAQVTGQGFDLNLKIDNPMIWDVEEPNLYRLTLKAGEDCHESTFGFRHAVFKKDGFYLNNKKLKLMGLNRHQCYPRSGYAMPETPQRLDARRIKDLGCNIVRTSHYMQSPYFLDECDKIGLLVLEEIPGWQYTSKDPQWRDLTVQNTRAMVQRDYNHPSIILWNVRINEGEDDDELYERTNEAAHSIDRTRQTGGTRNFTFSHLIEDVYTYNDFNHDGTNEAFKKSSEITKDEFPLLVTEHNGHMFSTKTFDDALHRESQVLRHAKVIDQMFLSPRVSGAIGWCFADYNTHSNFGSGDGNCYHGVTDGFRNPKDAAWLYKSQCDKETVLHIASTMDFGDWAKNYLPHIVILTNADSVVISTRENRGNKEGETDDEAWEVLGEFYPDRKTYKGLPHPPIIARNLYAKRLQGMFPRPKDAQLANKLIDIARFNSSFNALKPYYLQILSLLKRNHMSLDELKAKGGMASCFGIKRKASWLFEAYKDGVKVATQAILLEQRPRLELRTSNPTISLNSDTFDVCQVDIEAKLEGFANPLPYCFEPLMLSLEGPMELYQTPNLISLQGGRSAVYLRTISKAGTACLKVSSPSLGQCSISIEVTE